jgi:spore coat polysaccharide biosynthesis protein SpsF (cytidylyltransferase family)
MKRRLLDILLDRVKPGVEEVTFVVTDYTPEQKAAVEDAARARGFDVSGDGKTILVRDLRNSVL